LIDRRRSEEVVHHRGKLVCAGRWNFFTPSPLVQVRFVISRKFLKLPAMIVSFDKIAKEDVALIVSPCRPNGRPSGRPSGRPNVSSNARRLGAKSK
jgi:hypothetical protein